MICKRASRRRQARSFFCFVFLSSLVIIVNSEYTFLLLLLPCPPPPLSLVIRIFIFFLLFLITTKMKEKKEENVKIFPFSSLHLFNHVLDVTRELSTIDFHSESISSHSSRIRVDCFFFLFSSLFSLLQSTRITQRQN